jgi:flagellar biosynthetic protein FliQ
MNPSYLISFFQEAVTLAATLALPPLMIGLVIGLMIAIFQAVTQIQEQTLVLIPKIIIIVATLLFLGNWMLSQLIAYTIKVFNLIPTIPG